MSRARPPTNGLVRGSDRADERTPSGARAAGDDGGAAAALACLNQLVSLGLKRENIFVCDIKGVVYKGRKELMARALPAEAAGHKAG